MPINTEELCATAAYLTGPGKGLLASDESTGTLGKRLAKAGLENTEVSFPQRLLAILSIANLCKHWF